jgi:phosphoglycerate dehydrogenase-like enzyme
MTGAATRADRGLPNVHVLIGTERFSSQHSWSELTALMPIALQATLDVQWCPPCDGFPNLRSGSIPGTGATRPGEALAGSTVCIVGLGAVGSHLARRLNPFEVRLIGVRRDVLRGAPPTTPDIEIVGADRLHEALTAADAVILTASHEPGRPPLIDRAALAAMRPGARLVNVARGALIDEAALLDALDQGRLAGAGLDVFTHEPYPPSAPLAHHPKVIATAHNAALTTGYFGRAARSLGEALAAHLDGRRPPNAINAPTKRRQLDPAGHDRPTTRPGRVRTHAGCPIRHAP